MLFKTSVTLFSLLVASFRGVAAAPAPLIERADSLSILSSSQVCNHVSSYHSTDRTTRSMLTRNTLFSHLHPTVHLSLQKDGGVVVSRLSQGLPDLILYQRPAPNSVPSRRSIAVGMVPLSNTVRASSSLGLSSDALVRVRWLLSCLEICRRRLPRNRPVQICSSAHGRQLYPHQA